MTTCQLFALGHQALSKSGLQSNQANKPAALAASTLQGNYACNKEINAALNETELSSLGNTSEVHL